MSDKSRLILDIVILAIVSALSVASFCLIPLLHVDSSTDVFLPKDADVMKANDLIERQFGSMDAILIGVKVRFGSVTDRENLAMIRTITDRAEALPSVGRVISLTNAEYIKSSESGMEVVPLLSSDSPSEIDEFRRRLTDWQDMYLGTILSANGKMAAIIVQPEKGTQGIEHEEIYEKLLTLTKEFTSDNVSFPIAGHPVVKREINRSIITDLVFLIPIAAFIILIVLFFSFRRAAGVVMPILSLAISASYVIAVMALLHITFTIASMLVPVLLLVVGSAYSIHVMSHFYDDLAHLSGFVDYNAICTLTHQGIKKVWLPVLLAGLTTAAGFLSNLSSPLEPFRAFGVLSALGVAFSQITSLVIIPVFLRLRYRKGIDSDKFHRGKSAPEKTKMPGIFIRLETIVRKGFVPAIVAGFMFIGLTLVLVPTIDAGTNMKDFFQPSSPVVTSAKIFNNEMSGSSVLTVMITSDKKAGILNPGFLSRLDDFSTYMQGRKEVGHVQTIVPSIKRINKIMNSNSVPYQTAVPEAQASEPEMDLFSSFDDEDTSGRSKKAETTIPVARVSGTTVAPRHEQDASALIANAFLDAGPNATVSGLVREILSETNYEGEAYNEIPADPAKYGKETEAELADLIAQYLVLYSGNLDMMINDALEPDRTLISIQLKDERRDVLTGLKNDISDYWSHFLPSGWSVVMGGGAAISLTLSDLVIASQVFSLVAALVIVWILVALMFRSAVAGFIGMIPVGFALAGVFIFMGFFHINIDIVTSILSSLAIGIGVDYGIHYMDAYKRAVKEKKSNVLEAVYRTTGKAIFFNALSVACGFLSLVISRFVPIQQMGTLFFAAMLFAGVSSLTILPMVLHHMKPQFIYKEAKRT